MTPIHLFDENLASRAPADLLAIVEWYREQLRVPLQVAEGLLGQWDALEQAAAEEGEVAPLLAQVAGHLGRSDVWAATLVTSLREPCPDGQVNTEAADDTCNRGVKQRGR